MSARKKPKPRTVVTDATKAKLPKPKRKLNVDVEDFGPRTRKRREIPKGKVAALRKAFEEHRANTDAPLTASDIIAIREKAKAEYESRAIPCGEDVTTSQMTTIDGMTWSNASIPHRVGFDSGNTLDIPPVTEPQPWLVRALNWLDEAPGKVRRWLGRGLVRLARGVMAVATWVGGADTRWGKPRAGKGVPPRGTRQVTDADLWKAINVYKQRTGVTPTHAYASPRTIQELFAVMFGGPRLDAPPYPVMRCCGVIVVPRNDVPPHTFFLETAP